MEVNSLSFFSSHWAVWKILGVTRTKMKWPKLYIAYSIIMHLSVTVYYPMHLALAAFRNTTLTDNIMNFGITVTCFSCSAKFAIYIYNFRKVHRIEELFQQLDLRVEGTKQRIIYNQLANQLRNILFVFIGIYLPIGLTAELAFMFKDERALMYPAWFPFDWVHSTRNFYMAHLYQIFGILFLLLQNYVNDCFPAVVLCLLSSHINMLYVRFEDVGQNNSPNAEEELEECITDHKRLLELFGTIDSLMSWPMLIQFGVTGLNACIGVAGLLFFVTDSMTRAYLFFYALGITLEIFPICYYGTDIQIGLEKLHYAAFSCNWTSQTKSFKRKLMLFVECSLKQSSPMAGGMLRIHVDTFFSTLKFAYSLFTVLINMRK